LDGLVKTREGRRFYWGGLLTPDADEGNQPICLHTSIPLQNYSQQKKVRKSKILFDAKIVKNGKENICPQHQHNVKT
jgi:hypothetical protein